MRLLAQLAGKPHARQRLVGFGSDIQQLGIQLHDIRLLGKLVAFPILHLNLSGHLGSTELTNICHVATVIGSLQADEVELGLAQEAINIKVGGSKRCWSGGGECPCTATTG